MFCNNQSNTGNNLIEYSAKGAVWPNACLAAGNVKAADPLLSAPANNGGPTLTQLPAANSPALNAGSGCAAIDQRGNPRDTAVCDLGAVEIK